MNIKSLLEKIIEVQKIDLKYDNLPFSLYLTNDELNLCFLEDETDDAIIVCETNFQGQEELRIVNKKYITHINIIYNISNFIKKEDKLKDRMFL